MEGHELYGTFEVLDSIAEDIALGDLWLVQGVLVSVCPEHGFAERPLLQYLVDDRRRG